MDVQVICQQVCQSIDVIIDEKSGVGERHTANQLIEDIKCSEDVLVLINVSIGLLNQTFVDSNKSIVYKHFGLQLLEFAIKYHWNKIDKSLKQDIKQLIESWFDVSDLFRPEDTNWRHLMNGSSRCVVEVVMREWPQNWPQFMPILLRNRSHLSLYCIWQLADDIGIAFKPNNGQRRREITNELNKNINSIYEYISKCLVSNDLTLCTTSLSTLTVLFEWTQLDANLLKILVVMLANDCADSQWVKAKQSICDCLLVCLNRKQLKQNDSTTLQTLFSADNVGLIVQTIRKYIDLDSKDHEIQSLTKRIVMVMSDIGQQMVVLSDPIDLTNPVVTLCLETMFHLFSHSNIIFNSISVQFWLCLVKNSKKLSDSNSFVNSLHMTLINQIPHKISTQLFDKSLLGFEFDDNESFDSFFYKFRADTIDLLRQLTILDQKFCFNFVTDLLTKALIQSISGKNDWDVLAQLSAAVFNKITDKNEFCIEASKILQLLIEKGNKVDADLISSQLSCISALTIFLPHIQKELIFEIIKMTLLLAAFTIDGQDKFSRSKEVKNLRRHACSLFIKICQTYPTILVPLFDGLKAHIHSMCSDVQQFSQMEKCALNEGLILISNELPDIEVQKKFIDELIWSINWISSYTPSADQLFYEMGLCESSLTDTSFGNKRANTLYAINLTICLLNRTKSERNSILIPAILPLFNGIFVLIANLNTIWRPEFQAKCSQTFKSLVYAEINEGDKVNILDLASNANRDHILAKSDAYRMQTFIWSLHDLAFNTLGLAISSLSPQMFQQITDFKPVLRDIEFLPEWKLRMIVKNFIKPLIANCPQSRVHYERIGPIVVTLLPYVFNRVNDRWNAIKSRNSTLEVKSEDEEPIESEVVCDQINRLLSKEFIDLLTCILTPNNRKSNESLDYLNQNSESGNEPHISELGTYLLDTYATAIIYPTAKSLSWLDTTISLKTANLNALLIRKIINDNMIRDEAGVYFLLEELLTALSYFGEHDQNQSILLHLMLILYEGIAVKLSYDSIKLKLSEITGTQLKDWEDFHQKLVKSSQTKDKILFTDKRKKEFLRKLVSQVIGKNIGQMYKYNKVVIKNLKPIFVSKSNAPNDNSNEDYSLCLLFNDS